MSGIKRRKNIRLQDFNYSTNSFYFITNNTHFSKPSIDGLIKEFIKLELEDLSKRFHGVSIYYYSLMPTHIHVVLELENVETTIPNIWRVFKSITTVKARKSGYKEKHLWQLNYFEHVVRDDVALERIVTYIRNNPYKKELPLSEIYGDRIPKLIL